MAENANKTNLCAQCQYRPAMHDCSLCKNCYASFRRYVRLQEREWEYDAREIRARLDGREWNEMPEGE